MKSLAQSFAVSASMVCAVAAYGAPAAPPAPSDESIKACVKQIDTANQWQFDWRELKVGAARHPQNNYEALAFGRPGHFDRFGYPVHVVFNVGGLETIDATYWLIQDDKGHWLIPAICSL